MPSARARRVAMRGAGPGWNTRRVDRVVDHRQALARQAEALVDLGLHHPRNADHRAAGAGSRTAAAPPPACSGDTGSRASARRCERRRVAQALLEPDRVHAVAGAVDVAAGDALVRLHERRRHRARARAQAARAKPASRQRAADVGRVDDHGVDARGRASRGHAACTSVSSTPRAASASSARSTKRSAPP